MLTSAFSSASYTANFSLWIVSNLYVIMIGVTNTGLINNKNTIEYT